MDVTPALKKELAEWLENYWTTYLRGDISTWQSFIRDDYRNIGGTKEEIWNSKQEIIDYTNKIMNQMVGTVEIRNREIEVIPYGEYMMVNEFTDIYVKIDEEWSLYGPFRMSSLLEKTNLGWIALHQHGSYPDMKAMEGEAFSMDAVKAENAQLLAAVKNRTIELEQKNRKLEIEAATERVRVQSMSMHHPDDLDKVNKEILTQLNSLQIQGLSGVTFYLVDPDGWVKAWDFSSPGNIGNKKSYTLQFDFKKYEMMGYPFRIFQQTDLNYLVADYPLEKLERAVFELEEINPEVATVVKEALAKGILTHQWSACARIADGILGIDLISPPSEDTKTIVLKIAGAFNQAYQRFLDLQKAEKQAKEAQIETALEKVRSRTMAMHSSQELGEAVDTLLKQFKILGFDAISSWVSLMNPKESTIEFWTKHEEKLIAGQTVHLSELNNFEKEMESWKKGEEYIHLSMPFKVAKLELKKIFGIELVGDVSNTFYFLQLRHKYGFLGLGTLKEANEEIRQTVQRFTKVFEQTYTRFLDLQKAEAQAREARIEAALEKVRSRSLAMHKSVELNEVVSVLFERLKELQIPFTAIGIATRIEGSKDLNGFVCGQNDAGLVITNYRLPYFDNPIPKDLYNALENQLDPFVAKYTKEEKDAFYNYVIENTTEFRHLPEDIKQMIFDSTNYTISMVAVKNAVFNVNDFEGKVLTKNEIDIIQRFSRVFDQAYTRFLDLQKVEEQAKEAQIELSLERIRSQVTAMQESSDLLDIVVTMRTEFVKLGHEAHYFWHMRWLPERYDKAMTSGDGTKIGMVMTLPRHIHGDIPLVADWEKTKEPTVVLAMEVEMAVDYIQKMITLGDFEQVDPQAPTLDDIRHIGGLTFVMARTTHGEIGYSLPGVVTDPPKNAVDTLIRFAGVFDLAYKRFEDLKSAERQHREAQIELALERVRARTMAMQKSEELADAAFVLFEQLRALGGNLWGTGFGLCHEHVEKDEFWFANENGVFPPVAIPNTTDPAHKQMYQGWQKKTDFLSIEKSGVALKSHYDYMLSLPEVRLFFQKIIDEGISFPEKQQWNAAYFSKGYLLIITLEPYPEPEIFKRFAKVFEQTYTRFLDLQKAEKQAREAEIQLALERVRARSLAMHRSEELADISMELVKQVQTLGMESWFCAFNIYDDDPRGSVEWGSNGQGTFPQYRTPREGVFLRYFEAGQRGETLLVNEIGEEVCPAHYEYLCGLPGVGEQLLQMKEVGIPFPTSQIDHVAFFKYGYVLFITYEPAPESHDIFKRFANVFEQSYTRFLDLQKAEAQTREAKIEGALEKVRSRTMGMQNSDELAEVANVLFAEMNDLVHNLWTCGFVLCEKGREEDEWWLSLKDGFSRGFFLPNVNDYAHATLYEGWLEGDSFRTVQLDGDKLQEHYDWLMEIPVAKNIFDDMEAAGMQRPEWQKLHAAYFSKGYLVIITREPCPEEEIFKRFAKVFDQTYTRFLDLQKAEAQARESKIETALEKVRSRTMGMQSSEELPEVANLLFTEVRSLGIPAWSCGYNILAEDKKTATAWMSSEGIMQTPFQLRLFGEASFDEMGEFILSDHTMFVQELGGKALEDHYAYMKTFPDLKYTFENIEAKGFSLPTYQINHLCKFASGFLLFITYQPVSDAHGIFKRFTTVFDQTYTRFLDLKKAEAQTREAQIENALEKVRSRSLAMQSPDELIEVAQLLREEMGALGVEELETSSIYIQDESSGLTQCWFTIKNPENPDKAITDQMVIDLPDTWVGRKMDEFYRSPANQTSILMQGEGRIEWIRYCEEKSDLFGTSNFYGDTVPDRTYHLYKFSNGYIGAAAPGEISPESWELLKRATAVFSFAYTRFRDLQMAQASARTAMRQASLDRVRADISSMRNADDLDKITPLIFKELTVLGVPFIRCGVFIIQEKQKIVEAYLSSPEGNSLGVLRLPYKASELTYQTVEAWRKGEVYKQHWNKEDFIQWINQLMKEDQIQNGSTYQGTAAPPESLDLHFVPFAQGMLYVGAVSPLDEKELELVQTLAKAFSIAYARFEDFVKLEQAKAEVESAMTELKATQSQLVQQEKLASLGQLTAGIAHEIKNPLNFVNNFSEVSLEMVDEVIDEVKTQGFGYHKIITELLDDIQANLRKIHEHGSRANNIVNSMLQHSRGGSGKKEETDLNVLIKEYVNLSFHGMRAGKSPINVDIVLDLDSNLKAIPIIKEDFTRVIINLCNNAFDAMRQKSEKVKDNSEKYFPKLIIRTKIDNEKINIEVEDNGPGIPDKIKDKILQPFFTTKKGTDGTGLGLSITHDIIKAHGGELNIESYLEDGALFIISLPENPSL